MNAEQLKNSILQRAIEGKLVEQREEEGTAVELLREIKAEKARLVKEGKLKKEKPLPTIKAEEIPFEIPESWEWVRLGNIVYNRGQEKPIEDFVYIDIGSIDNKRQQLGENETIIASDKAPSRARKLVDYGDIIYSTVRPYLHNACIIDRNFSRKPIASTGFAVMTTYQGVLNKYLFHFLLSPQFDSYANSNQNSKGVAYPAINDKALYSALVPLPPLAEQKRIVAKIEELLPHVEQYGKAHDELTALNEKFPDAMKKSILQYAMEGKLVEQREEEGTAKELLTAIKSEKAKLVKEGKLKKEKPLPEIKAEEIPFEIPESWEWVRLGDVFNLQAGKNIVSAEIHETQNEQHPYSCYGGNGLRGYVSTFNREGDYPLIGRQGALCGNINFASNKFYATEHAVVVETYCNTSVKWAGLFLKALNLNQYATATAQPGLAVRTINQVIVPLPPLAEQKRIVAKIEELLACCGALEK